MCECFADLCLVAGCGDISSNVLCRMVHHAGSQGFGRCSLSSLFFFFYSSTSAVLGWYFGFFAIFVNCFAAIQLHSGLISKSHGASGLHLNLNENLKGHTDPRWSKQCSKESHFLPNCSCFLTGETAECTESLLYYRISVVVLLQGLSKFLQRALPECVP